ncbi:hypothetical protein C8A03DRAFT_14166 [Achaetomium macrosporum]|uniref:Uncharacterized protein n=1 Tax=Achaetomium macrosporum TaxID=79813 RepID=A0AAN7CCE1_9PEZI|nr:hypothetical protein C8A03DRAFT_14166 [Achaetomium macrosporum]
MDLGVDDFNGDDGNGECIMDRRTMSVWPAPAPKQSRLRRSARQALMGLSIRTGRVKRQQRKGALGSRQDRALTAIAAAAMLALVPFCKPSASLDGRFAKYILLPNCQSKMDNEPVLGDCQLDSPVESRRPRAREEPCAFRTRLADRVADSEDDIAFESTDKVDAERLRFDDAQCISVGRSMGRFKTHQGLATHRKALSDPTGICSSSWANEDDGDDENNMEAMNMPFWNLPRRQKRRTTHYGEDIPDDMSIISDISLIPTYFPSDALKQQRHHHRALVKHLFLAKAKAARQTMRQLKRSCRDAVGHISVEPRTHRTPECVPVGAAF